MTAQKQSAQRHNHHSRPDDDTIEAIIQHAISARQDVRPLRDTRTQLFVGNLPYRVRWQDLKDLFRKAGTVLRADVSLGPDNRSRGYGTVLLATAEDAGRAVDMFNGYTWQTRVLEVRLDRLMPEYELGRPGTGVGGPMANSLTQALGPGLSGTPSSIAGGSGPFLGLGIGRSGSAGGAANSAHGVLGSGLTALTNDPGPSPDLLLAGFNPLPNPSLRAPHLSQNFVPSRPSSSSAAVQDPLDFLHSSRFTSDAAEFQSTDPATNRTLFVGNLPFHIQWQDLKDLFRQAGTILRADVALGPDNRSRGFGTVVFATEADAERAVQMFNGYEHNGRVLKVYNDKFSSPLPSAFLPPTSSYATLTTPASPSQHQYSQHLNPPHRDSSSRSRHSSISSSAAHSVSSSPLPARTLPNHSHHGQTHREYSNLGLNPPSAQSHGSATQQQQPGHTTLAPGFLYDYGQPTSPHEYYQRQQQEKEYFEKVPALQQQAERNRIRQEKDRSIEKVGLLQKEHRDRDLESESDILRPLALGPATASSVLDIDSLTTSLASMEYSPSGGRPHGSVESPASISASMSISASGSTSNSNSNPSSIPHSTVPSKPSSTKPTLGAFQSPHYLPSISSSSLPAHFGMEELSLGTELGGIGGTVSVGGSRKASFTSSAGTGPGAYDRHYQHHHLYPPSISTRTSTDSATTTTTDSSVLSDTGSMATSGTEDDIIGYRSHFLRQDLAQGFGSDEKYRASSAAPSETGSGRLSRSSRAESIAGSRSGSQVGDKDNGNSPRKNEPTLGLGRERHGSTSSRGHGQSTSASATQEGQMQKQHPHHPGPIALPPPPSMSFNPMQMPMMMPLSTMTPGHPHGHAPTPHAYPMGSMMNFGMNISPLYHPAHPMSAMAAAAMHGGGSPSPFAMYPGPPAMTGAMMTPHGLPPITPSMPPFTFFPQQYYASMGSVGAKGSLEENHKRGGGREGEGNAEGRERSSVNVQSVASHQMQRSQPLRLNLNAVQGGFSPGVAMSPGTFYGRPGQVPHPNPSINAAVGAPVHSVATHVAQSSVHPHPIYQPSGFVAGTPHGGYPYPNSPGQGDFSGGEPQGYFDHIYFPGASGQSGNGARRGESTGPGEESRGEGPEEAVSPAQASSVSGDEDAEEANEYVPSRTHSVGHTRPPSPRGRGKFHRSGSDPSVREAEQGVADVENKSKEQDVIV